MSELNKFDFFQKNKFEIQITQLNENKIKILNEFQLNLKDLNQTYLKFMRQNRIIYHLKYYFDYKIITKKKCNH